MNLPLANLFARSPFGPMQTHMEAVVACTQLLPELFDALYAGKSEEIRSVAQKISQAESHADEVKNDLRSQLPSTLFMPVDRRDILEILAVQDAIADKTEDVGVLLTLRDLQIPDGFEPLLRDLVQRVMETVQQGQRLNKELDTLVEAGFSGPEAQRLQDLIAELCRAEHEADKVQDQLARKLFCMDELSAPEFALWNRVIQTTGAIADRAETMGNRLRLLLAR